MKPKVFIVVLAAAVLFLSGCAENTARPSEAAFPSSSSTFPSSYMIEQENHFDYQPGLECSAFASAYLLRHYGEEASGLKLFENFPGKISDGSGVYPQGIVTFFSDHGYNAEFTTADSVDDLKMLVSQGDPVIVFIHADEPYTNPHYTHYVPVVGYDEDYIYFAESLDYKANCREEEGLRYNRKTPIDEFERLWANIEGMYEKPYFLISE